MITIIIPTYNAAALIEGGYWFSIDAMGIFKVKYLFKKLINHLLKNDFIACLPADGKVVYLTFDDGPEPGITEFVLDELSKYRFKGTFFCTGENVQKYPEYLKKIINAGHAIGNHSYLHKNAYIISAKQYAEDVSRADGLLQTPLFRPPNGCLTLTSWLRLRKKFRIIYWTTGSQDWLGDNLDVRKAMHLLRKTQSGDIILFHFSQALQAGTRKLLPVFLKWLSDEGFVSHSIH